MSYRDEFRKEVHRLIDAGVASPAAIQKAMTERRREYVAYSTVKNIADKYKKERAAAREEAEVRPPSNDGKVVLAIPDLHCPFHHPDALEFLCAVRDKIRPDEIICLGDEVDFHSYSRWPKDPDGLSPGMELSAAIEALTPFYIAFPEVKVCVSNHTIRPQSMMKLSGIPKALITSYSQMLKAPERWTWHEHIIIDDVRYMHGDQGKGGMHGWTKNSEVYHQSVVVGHWHSKAGVFYDSHMFNLNAGCLIDATSYAFDYAKHSHKRPNLGCGVVFGGRKAAFLPMLTDEHNRWVGRV